MALFLTGGRAAFSGLVIGLLLLFLTAGNRFRVATLTLCIVGSLSFSIITSYFSLFKRNESYAESYEIRNGIWQDAIKIFDEKPFMGIGIGNYQSYVSIHAQDQIWELGDNEFLYFDHPESGYLKILTEYGIVGFVLLFSMILIPIFKALSNYIIGKADQKIFFFLASIVCWMVSFTTVYSIGDKRILILIVTITCLLIYYTKKSGKIHLEQNDNHSKAKQVIIIQE